MRLPFLSRVKRTLDPQQWGTLRHTAPVSRTFGLDRGQPVDRIYIEDFLASQQAHIQGAVLEIAESTYSRRFGDDVKIFEVLHARPHPKATIVGDLTDVASLPARRIDCFICTQTLNFIYDVKSAVKGIHHLLRPGGCALITVAGISQISRYDADRWGDYWRFTPQSLDRLLGEVFGPPNVELKVYGNVLAATAFLQGFAAEELTEEELMVYDADYPVTIAARATRLA